MATDYFCLPFLKLRADSEYIDFQKMSCDCLKNFRFFFILENIRPRKKEGKLKRVGWIDIRPNRENAVIQYCAARII